MIDFEDPNILVSDSQPIPKSPDFAITAWNNWREVANKEIHCRSSDRYLWCDWADPERQHNDGLEDTKKYVQAFRYLPNLLLRCGKISLKPDPYTRKKVFDLFVSSYRTRSLWLDYYLLHDLTALAELKFKPPRKREHTPGKVSAKRLELVKDVWVAAEVYKNPVCQWILSYDSPAQVWFGLSALWLEKQWKEKVTPGATPTKGNWYEKRHDVVDLMSSSYRGIEVDFKGISNKEEVFTIRFKDAFAITQVSLIQSGYCSEGHSSYLEAHKTEINHVRKGGTADGGGVQQFGVDKDGVLAIGKYELESYSESTDTGTLVPKRQKKGWADCNEILRKNGKFVPFVNLQKGLLAWI